MTIRTITSGELYKIRDLAYANWPTAYKEILSKVQLEYMLEKFYAVEALEQQWKEAKHIFCIISNDQHKPLGFVSYQLNSKHEKTKIHKIYVLPETQGTGLGKKLFYYVKEKALENNQKAIFLNVNKYNRAKFFYEKLGFTILKEEVIDIGNNYVMDDYVMEVGI